MNRTFVGIFIGAALLAALSHPLPSLSRDLGDYAVAEDAAPPEGAAKELTLDEVLGKYYGAIGGLGNWQSLNTLVIKGTIFSQNAEITTTAEYMRPDKCRVSYKIGGKLVVQSFNGETAWQQSALSKSVAPETLDAERTNYLRDRCGIESPLIDYAKKNLKLTLEGKDLVDGKDSYKIKVAYSSGNFQYYLLDALSFLPVKTVGFYTVGGKQVVMMTRFGEYKRVGNILVPFKLAIEKKGNAPREEYVVQSVTPNTPLDPAIFNMP
jgi:hypothetical protein